MANEQTRTHTVLVASSAVYAAPSNPDSMVAIRNIGANGVWVSTSFPAGTAVAEGSNCTYVGPGETEYFDWCKDGYAMRAVTADNKVVINNGQGRTRR